MKIGALFPVPLATALVLFLSHPVPADPPTLEETYQKWIKTRVNSLIVKGRLWKNKLRLTPYAPMKYNMPIAKPDPNIVYNMPIAKPDPSTTYNMPGAWAPKRNPRFRLPKYFSLPDALSFSLPDTLKLGPTYVPFRDR